MVGISSFPLLVARFGDLNHPTGQKSHATGIVIKNWSVLAWPCLTSAQISAQMVPTPKMIYSSFSWHIVLSLHVLVGFLRPKQSSLESAECWIYTLQHSSNRYNPKMGSLRIWHSPTNQSLRRFAVSNHRTRSWIKVDQSSQPLVLTQHTLWNHVQALKIKSWRKAQIHIWNDLTITNLNLRRHVFMCSFFTRFKVRYIYTIDYLYIYTM